MNGVVGLRLIGTPDEISAVLWILAQAVVPAGARLVIDPNNYSVRRTPDSIRVYAEVTLPKVQP
ncbi:hypothetical protein OHA40_16770 [Nocardia sp. NBC_00508]|uniref:hypothetical protein n=1 Tax=Nocardia sp. NBC_00508 TaxID=2975992 RepID=UPI002E817978|nr:hypothetical protein [Nocardia sp. NBC_00508]WUD69622.1 hypothetical protein OHA40_16770 [Nocardia sp. NBC_00508]